MLLEPKMVVHCETIEQAKEFISEAYKQGFKWGYGYEHETFYNKYKENTVYMLGSNYIIHYSSLDNLEVLHSVNSTYRECVKFKDLKRG